MALKAPHRWSLRSESSPRAQRGILHALTAPFRALGRAPRFVRKHPKRSILALLALIALAAAIVFWRVTKRSPDHFRLRAAVPGDASGFAGALYQSVGVRMQPGHRVELLQNGAVFAALEETIRGARSSIHVVMYIWEKGAASDRITRAIVERAKAGVRCRLLLDAFGSPKFEETVAGPLTRAGCELRIFRPVVTRDTLERNHRKILIVDGTSAVTGGFGVRDDWLGDGVHAGGWRDTNVRFTGPAVAEAQQAFAENWQEAGGELLEEAAFPPPKRQGQSLAALVSSTGSPVLTRSERLTQLMIAAARRGVDVRVLTNGSATDVATTRFAGHRQYTALLAAGVRIWEYNPTTVHAKTFVADGVWSSIMTANFDNRSISYNDEVALVVQGAEIGAKMDSVFVEDLNFATEIRELDFRRRPLPMRLAEWLAGLIAGML